MSIRNVSRKYPHPFDEDLCILVMDDGYPLVLKNTDAVGIDRFSAVHVTGPTRRIGGITSYGDIAQPLLGHREEIRCSPNRRLERTLSEAFCGLEHTQMAGIPADVVPSSSGTCIEATRIQIGENDKWVAFFGNRDEFCCFDSQGTLIKPRPGEYSIWSKFLLLDNYYTFCGVLHRPEDGGPSSFVLHCIWNRTLREPVGPPLDRRIARHIGVPFGPSVPVPDKIGDRSIMVRVDNQTPLLL